LQQIALSLQAAQETDALECIQNLNRPKSACMPLLAHLHDGCFFSCVIILQQLLGGLLILVQQLQRHAGWPQPAVPLQHALHISCSSTGLHHTHGTKKKFGQAAVAC
jgi:hypothetical protein